MKLQRSSGVLLHITSLSSRGEIGDLGQEARAFLDFLACARVHVWQVLPLSPTGYGNSPYAATSAFAGNTNLISLETLADWGWIAPKRLEGVGAPGEYVDFTRVAEEKVPLLEEAARNFLARGPLEAGFKSQWEQYERFCHSEASWLADYALYAVLRRALGTGAWADWPEPLKRRNAAALVRAASEHGPALAVEQALQFAFALQWKELRNYATQNGIRIMGDVAIFVSMDSADVWAHPELFELDEDLKPIAVAGVPPDYFSRTGQRWGNPVYRWSVLEEQGFDWWIERMRQACRLYDIVRLDHFRGFEAFWRIPAEEETAVKGDWIKAPGRELFGALESALADEVCARADGSSGRLPLVAEDLGEITPEVIALRKEIGLPGMKVLQFGFSDKGAHAHLPHCHTCDTVAYTGTHDNNTTQGWWDAATETEHAAMDALVGPVDGRPCWPLMRATMAGVAELAVVPAQDLLELGAEARMNTPAVAAGNWSWRAPQGSWSPDVAERFKALVEVTDRDCDPLARPQEEGDSA